jgi:hypothetical protein
VRKKKKMIDERLQRILDSKKNPIAKALLRDLFENDDFRKSMCARLEQLLCEQRGRVGYNMQEGGDWTWQDDELAEGIGSGLMHLVKTAATHTAARALGVRPSTIHGFTKALSNRPKKVAAPAKAAKPVHTKPTATLHTSPSYHMVMPSDVHSKIGHPDHSDHDGHLSDFINHHNKFTSAKEKGDHSAAVVHYRARNHALADYTQTAPKSHLKYLKADKIQQMMTIKP